MKLCLICYRKEKGTHQPDRDCEFICANCVQKLRRASQEQIKAIYQKAVDQGLERKAQVLKTLILEEEDEYDPKAGETLPNMVRERSMRPTQPARN